MTQCITPSEHAVGEVRKALSELYKLDRGMSEQEYLTALGAFEHAVKLLHESENHGWKMYHAAVDTVLRQKVNLAALTKAFMRKRHAVKRLRQKVKELSDAVHAVRAESKAGKEAVEAA